MPSPPPSRGGAAMLAVVFVYAACGANMLRMIWWPSLAIPPLDFSCFWYAGQAWLAGASPYDPAAASAGPPPEPFADRPFFYPPAMRPVFEAFALLPFGASRLAFALFSVALWGLVCVGVCRRLPTVRRPILWWCAVPVFVSAGLVPARLSVEEGQTVILLVAAVAGLLAVRGRGRWAEVALVLTVLSLKPQLGLPVAAVVLLRWADLRAAGTAGVLVLALTLYGTGGRPDLVLPQFLHNLSLYGAFPENGPGATSGLPTVLALLGLPSPPKLALVGAATACAALAGGSRLPRERALLLALTAALLILPSHRHGYLLLVPMIPVALGAPPRARLAMMVAATMMSSSLAVRHLAPQPSYGGFGIEALIETLAIILFAGGVLAWLLPEARRGRSDLLVERADLRMA